MTTATIWPKYETSWVCSTASSASSRPGSSGALAAVMMATTSGRSRIGAASMPMTRPLAIVEVTTTP